MQNEDITESKTPKEVEEASPEEEPLGHSAGGAQVENAQSDAEANANAVSAGGDAVADQERKARRVSRHDPDSEDWEIMRRIVSLDKMLTSPGRLAVLAALWRAGDLDYVYLQKLAGSSQGNLATHCRKLEEAGLIEARKMFIHRRSNTRLFITESGRDAIREYVEQLRSLMKRVQSWQPAVDDYRDFYRTDGEDAESTVSTHTQESSDPAAE